MTQNYLSVNNLKISKELLSFVNNELLKGLDISEEKFWLGFDKTMPNYVTNKEYHRWNNTTKYHQMRRSQ